MENIIISETPKTPFVNFDWQKGLIEIKGKSIPENPVEFYEPLWAWLDEFAKTAPSKIIVNIQLKYINSSSLKCMVVVFKKLKEIRNRNKDIEMVYNWYYDVDDEDMFDTGKEFEEQAGVPFNMIEIEEK
ncbi:MAG: DUF1987 domain-containing protein [Bacteroidales bacterium]|nr:DUF1987 domain-containing protein [Bacteroidales bacterium]